VTSKVIGIGSSGLLHEKDSPYPAHPKKTGPEPCAETLEAADDRACLDPPGHPTRKIYVRPVCCPREELAVQGPGTHHPAAGLLENSRAVRRRAGVELKNG